MFITRRFSLAITFAFGLSFGAAVVDADESVFSGLPITALRMMQPGIPVEQVLYLALAPIRRYDRDHDGLDAADIDTAQSVVFAKRRAYGFSYYLAMDLNGDLNVSEAEINTSLSHDVSVAEPPGGNSKDRAEIDARVKQLMAVDFDEDGTITPAEVGANSEQYAGREGGSDLPDARSLLQADTNGDGHITATEAEAKVRKAFAAIDKNGDGMISKEEHSPFADEIEQMEFQAAAWDCALPKAPANEQLWIITLHHGLSKPTVTVTGPRDETRLTRIVIEPGDTPLYVVLTRPEMIWQFEGATSRLKHVVVFTYPQNLAAKARPDKFWSGAGVVGVPKERITFFPEDKCGSQFAVSTSPQGKARIGRLVQATGLTAYKTLERDGIVGVALPSGDMLSTADERDYFEINNHLYVMGRDGILEVLKGEAEAEARAKERGIRGGIVPLEPSEVVSSGRVEVDPGAKLPQVTVTP